MPTNLPTKVAPSSLTWLGIARELTPGTPVAPTTTVPLNKNEYSPEDTPKFLPDEAIRGVMAGLFNEVQGVEDATFSYGGPVFVDTIGYWLDNLFGDQSTTGTTPTSSTTLSAATLVGDTTCTVTSGTGYSIGSIVQIDTGSVAEVVVLTAVTTNTLTFTNNPLRFPHASAATVAIVSAPFTHTFALLNSGDGQSPTHTVSDYTGLTATTGARSYPFCRASQIDFTGNAEQLLAVKITGVSWISAPAAATPVNTTTFTVPLANWRSTVSIGGTPVYSLGEWATSLKRTLQTYWTAQNSQNPYWIAQGALMPTATTNQTVSSDESLLLDMLTSGPLALQFAITNGQTGANELSLTINMTTAQAVKAKPDRNAVLVGYQSDWSAVANSTDVGGSAGLGPCTVTLVDAVPAY